MMRIAQAADVWDVPIKHCHIPVINDLNAHNHKHMNTLFTNDVCKNQMCTLLLHSEVTVEALLV